MGRREAYLGALGLTDWVRREAPAAPESPMNAAPVDAESAPTAPPMPASTPPTSATAAPASEPVPVPAATGHRSRVLIGPGSGSCLYLCGPDDDASTPLASDLARILGAPPVWGKVDEEAKGQPLELLIAERLFTQVVVFGEASALRVFGGQAPPTCGPARVTVVDDLQRLGGDAGARRSCWAALKAAGVVSTP